MGKKGIESMYLRMIMKRFALVLLSGIGTLTRLETLGRSPSLFGLPCIT